MTAMTSTTAMPAPQPQPLVTGLRALIIAAGFWLLSLTLTVASGSIAAVLACLAACALVDWRLQRPPLANLTTATLLAGAALLWLALTLIGAQFADSATLARWFSPITAFNVGEFIKWFALALSITFALRLLARRTSYGAAIEILFVAAAFVITLAAHRNGMIHRPFFIGDFALIRGIDPSTILMAMGGAAVLALAALLMLENNQRRLHYHFAILSLLCLSLVAYVQLFGLPTPQLTDDLGLTGQAQTGNSSARENPFRDGENDAQDREAPVAVVVFRDDYEPLNGAYYFRESAYSQFNGTMLDFARREDMDRDLIENFTNSRAETELMPGALETRTPVRMTVGMLIAHRNPFGLATPIAYENRPNPNNLRFKRTYDSYSLAPEYDYEYLLGRELGNPDWSEEVRQEYLRLPDDPRYEELARNLIANLRPEYTDDPFAKAWAIKTYLDENGIYSLKNEHAYAEDPAASFLFGDLTGYCMHFSFAATYMYRSLGIPARVGIGYSVPAANRSGGSSLLVQAIHGHAWPEIYFEGIGWVIVDPAPQQTLVDMTTDPQNDLQQLLGDMLRDEASFEDYLEAQQTSVISFTAILNTLYLVLLVGLITGYGVKVYRQLVPGAASPAAQYRLSYRAVADQLAGYGLRRKPGESREAFAARVSALAPAMTPLTRAHLSAALGSDPDRLSKQEWQQLRDKVQGDLQGNSQTWRRLAAMLNPFTWMLSR